MSTIGSETRRREEKAVTVCQSGTVKRGKVADIRRMPSLPKRGTRSAYLSRRHSVGKLRLKLRARRNPKCRQNELTLRLAMDFTIVRAGLNLVAAAGCGRGTMQSPSVC
jgi:hypothetical protein